MRGQDQPRPVNVSPKGLDGLRGLGPNRAAGLRHQPHRLPGGARFFEARAG
jgi:hypothetical protein